MPAHPTGDYGGANVTALGSVFCAVVPDRPLVDHDAVGIGPAGRGLAHDVIIGDGDPDRSGAARCGGAVLADRYRGVGRTYDRVAQHRVAIGRGADPATLCSAAVSGARDAVIGIEDRSLLAVPPPTLGHV